MNANAWPSVSVPAASARAVAAVERAFIRTAARRPPQYAGDSRKTVAERAT